MRRFDSSRRRLLVLAVAGLLAAAFAVPALAQNTTEDPTAGSEATSEEGADEADEETDDTLKSRWQERHADRQAAFAEALAEELDLPVDQVTDAVEAVRDRLRQERMDARSEAMQERLDEAVANGELTQEQADAIAEADEAGVLGKHRGHRRHGHGMRGWFGGPDGGGADATAPATGD